MLKRASISIVVLALLGLEGAATANTPTGPTTALEDIRLPSGAITAVPVGDSIEIRAPGLRAEDLLLQHLDPRDVRTHPDALRAFIETTTGTRLPDLRPEHSADQTGPSFLSRPDRSTSPEPPPPPDEVPHDSGTMSFPAPGGDLSGDGLDDLLVFEMTLPQETIVVRALRGTNGTQLWEVSLDAADAVPYPVSDLTGDGIDDLLLWEFRVRDETFSEDCPRGGSHCRYQYDATYDWVVGLRDGRHGTMAWSERYPGEEHYKYEYETEGNPPVTRTSREEERYDSPNYLVLPNVSGDHDGDGAADLILQGMDLAERYEAEWNSVAGTISESSGEYSLHTATRAEIVRGADGQVILRRTTPAGPGFTYLEPVGNLVGGPAPDLLWEESIIPDSTWACVDVDGVGFCPDQEDWDLSLDVEVVDGNTLQTAWTTSVPDIYDGFSMAIPEDVSGDGIDDILVFADVDAEMPFVTRLLSGVDGKQLWERRQSDDEQWSWDMPLGVGKISGDGTPDLVFGNFKNPLVGGSSARFIRVDGPTGQTLFETSHPFQGLAANHPFSFEYQYIAGMGDVNGDAVDDPMMGSLAEGYDIDPLTDEVTVYEVVSSSLVESGRTETVLHQNTAPAASFLEAAPDLSGDGVVDAFEWRYPIDADDDFGVVVHTLAPSATLWARALTGEEFWNLGPGGDHDGAAGHDMLYARNDHVSKDQGGWHWTSAVASLKGSTGAERWRRPA